LIVMDLVGRIHRSGRSRPCRTREAPVRPLEADVTGATTLRLVVTDYDGSKNSDHADRADARITCA
jgi:hypothetical protein